MARSITAHSLKDLCPGCGKKTGGPACTACLETKRHHDEAFQHAMLVKETLHRLFMRTTDTSCFLFRVMMMDMKGNIARQKGTVTSIPRELLRRAELIVGEDTLRKTLDEVKTIMKIKKSMLSKTKFPEAEKTPAQIIKDMIQELEDAIVTQELKKSETRAAKH